MPVCFLAISMASLALLRSRGAGREALVISTMGAYSNSSGSGGGET